jgi:hypothetical protein
MRSRPVGEEVERFVGVAGADAGDEIGAADLDVAFGGTRVADVGGVIAPGRGDREMDPADDDLGSEVDGRGGSGGDGFDF